MIWNLQFTGPPDIHNGIHYSGIMAIIVELHVAKDRSPIHVMWAGDQRSTISQEVGHQSCHPSGKWYWIAPQQGTLHIISGP
jgi:hypothetical protein